MRRIALLLWLIGSSPFPAVSAPAQLLGLNVGAAPTSVGCSPISPPSGGIYDSTSLAGSTGGAGGGTLTVGGSPSPDCATNGSTFVEDTSTGLHSIEVTGGVITHNLTAASLTATIYVRQGVGTRESWLVYYDQTLGQDTLVVVNPTTCTAAIAATTNFAGATASSTETAEPGGWCKVTLNTNPVTLTGIFVFLINFNGSTDSYAGDGTSSLLYWGLGLSTP